MDEVNLLPWREQKLSYERAILRRYFLFVMLAALLLLCVSHIWIAALNVRDERRLAALQLLAPEDESRELVESAEVPALTPEIFTLLAAARMHGVCYSRLEYSDHQITLTGQALNYTGLTQTMQALADSEHFGIPHLLNSRQEKPASPLQFVINTGE